MVVHIAPKGERNKSVNPLYADEHNRYAILQKHPEIYFSTMPLPFESREEVLAWICKNQLGRRNLTPEQKYYLMGKQYEAEKAAHGGDRKSSDAKSSSLKANLIDNSKTCDRIAEENGVSKDTVIRASKYMKGVEIAEELMPGLKQSILSGQTKVSKADMHRLARAAYNDRAQTLQDILRSHRFQLRGRIGGSRTRETLFLTGEDTRHHHVFQFHVLFPQHDRQLLLFLSRFQPGHLHDLRLHPDKGND